MVTGETLSKNESLAEQISLHFYKRMPSVHLINSFGGAQVYRLNFKGEIYDRILKLIKADPLNRSMADIVLREQTILQSLQVHGFEVPEVEFTQADGQFDGWVFTLMPSTQSRPLDDIYADNPDLARFVFARQGQYIARLSRTLASSILGTLSNEEALKRENKQWEWAFRELQAFRPTTAQSLGTEMMQAKILLNQPVSRLVNRDGPQILTDGISTFCAIDWDAAGPGHPLRDLGIVIAQHFVHRKKELQKAPWRDWLMSGFLQGKEMTKEDKRQLSLLVMYQLVVDGAFHVQKGNLPLAERALTQAMIEPQL